MLKLPVFDLVRKAFAGHVPYRTTLVEKLFPGVAFRVFRAATDQAEAVRKAMVAALAAVHDGFRLDFATGSRKHGDFIASNAATPVGSVFFDTCEKAIAYGGLLLTECREVFGQELRVLVVKDGDHGTGDCHGRASDAFLAGCHVRCDEGLQYRFGVVLGARGHLSKGTLVVGDVPEGVDLVLPLSSFKSFVPELGLHTWRGFFGIVKVAEPRRTKLGYQVLQWFSRKAVEADIWPRTLLLIETLRRVVTDNRAAVEWFKLEDFQAADETGEVEDCRTEQVLQRILAADRHQRLLQHPYVVDRIYRQLRRRWQHIATGGGLFWTGLMGLPDDSLPEATVCAPHLPEGDLIMTRFPVRSWADVRLVRNVHSRRHIFGCVWMSHQTAAAVAGDFDGDDFIFAPASEYPTLAAEILSWASRTVPPVVKVKQRKAHAIKPVDLAQTALDNADNMVGLVSNLIASACAQGSLAWVNRLAPELQIAVDKFKYNLDQDLELLERARQTLRQPLWLPDRKSEDAFLTRPMLVGQESDTTSWLIRKVIPLWRAPHLQVRPLVEFRFLFSRTDRHETAALELCIRYAQEVAQALARGGRDELTPVFEALREWAATRQDPEGWAAAVWHKSHTRTTHGKASITFQAFPDQVIAAINRQPELPAVFKVVGIIHNLSESRRKELDGTVQRLTLRDELWEGKLRLTAWIGDERLGLVSTETPAVPGTHPVRLTLATKGFVFTSIPAAAAVA